MFDLDPSLSRRERMDQFSEKLYWAIYELLPSEYQPAEGEPRGIVGGEKPSKI